MPQISENKEEIKRLKEEIKIMNVKLNGLKPERENCRSGIFILHKYNEYLKEQTKLIEKGNLKFLGGVEKFTNQISK